MIFRWWMAPVIGVGACAIANAVLISTAIHVRPEKVTDKPYADSAYEDERAVERAGFTNRGWTLDSSVDATGCTLTLHVAGGAVPLAGVVRLYRPDDRSSDRDVPWLDPAQPLRVALGRPGSWDLRIALRDSTGSTLVHEVRISRP